MTFADRRADDQKRERQQQQTQQQQAQQQTQQQQTHRLDQLIRWGGVAQELQKAIKADDSLHRSAQWPCMRLYLTGKCDGRDCKACGKPDKGRGDADVRACASKRLAEMVKKGAMSSDLASEIANGEPARA